MIALNRTNLVGQPYKLVEVFSEKPATSIRTAGIQLIVNHSIRDMAEWWHLWVMGEDIDTAFRLLTPEERLFLQKGGG